MPVCPVYHEGSDSAVDIVSFVNIFYNDEIKNFFILKKSLQHKRFRIQFKHAEFSYFNRTD